MRLRTRLGTSGLALLVLFLSCALVVSTPTNAHALDPKWTNLEKLEKIANGPEVKTAKGIGKFAIGFTPPGRLWKILGAASLAWGAYEATDYLINAPQPGGELPDWIPEMDGEYPPVSADEVIMVDIIRTGGATSRQFNITFGCTQGWVLWGASSSFYTCSGMEAKTNLNARIGGGTPSEADCKDNTTGATVVRAITANWGAIMSKPASGGQPASGATVAPVGYSACNSGETATAVRFGPGPTDTNSTQYLNNDIGWSETGVYDGVPEGEVTFNHAVIETTCRNALNGATEVIRTVSEWGTSETLAMPSCKARLGDDWHAVATKVIPMDPYIDDVPVDPEIWPEWDDVPDTIPEEWSEDLSPEEEAMPCRGTKDGCGLSIWIDGDVVTPGDGTTQTKITTLLATDPDRVTCKWGASEVEWKLCIPLLPGFNSPSGSTNIDPTKPDTSTPTQPTNPGDGSTINNPVPFDAKGCMKEVVSWNPVDWIYTPIKCGFLWGFKPTPSAWGWEAFVAQVSARPPTSIAIGLVTQMQAIADGFQSAGTCGVLADFGDGMAITCPDIRAIPGFMGLYALVQVALVGLTGFTVFHIFRTALGSEGS